MIHIPVLVVTKNRERFLMREETHTLVINAHGGLMYLDMEVVCGQPLVLINPQTGEEEGCRVVRVDQKPGSRNTVAFEFNRPAPLFWPITFPPADWKVASYQEP
ncbi:MAG TPA: hypothetical protein VMT51_00425 [Dongiaceae bacterium]|nr:hypothetical protein [Dongiaceae bacterium]